MDNLETQTLTAGAGLPGRTSLTVTYDQQGRSETAADDYAEITWTYPNDSTIVETTSVNFAGKGLVDGYSDPVSVVWQLDAADRVAGLRVTNAAGRLLSGAELTYTDLGQVDEIFSLGPADLLPGAILIDRLVADFDYTGSLIDSVSLLDGAVTVTRGYDDPGFLTSLTFTDKAGETFHQRTVGRTDSGVVLYDEVDGRYFNYLRDDLDRIVGMEAWGEVPRDYREGFPTSALDAEVARNAIGDVLVSRTTDGVDQTSMTRTFEIDPLTGFVSAVGFEHIDRDGVLVDDPFSSSVTYDERGNVTSFPVVPSRGLSVGQVTTAQLRWTANGELAEIQVGDEAPRDIVYDPLSRRIGVQNADGTWRRYIYADQVMLGEADHAEPRETGPTSLTRFFVPDGSGRPVATIDRDGGLLMLRDRQGRVWGVSDFDDPAAVLEYYSYDGLGRNPTVLQSVNDYASVADQRRDGRLSAGLVSAFGNDRFHSGMDVYDPEAGLYWAGHRAIDSEAGAFMPPVLRNSLNDPMPGGAVGDGGDSSSGGIDPTPGFPPWGEGHEPKYPYPEVPPENPGGASASPSNPGGPTILVDPDPAPGLGGVVTGGALAGGVIILRSPPIPLMPNPIPSPVTPTPFPGTAVRPIGPWGGALGPAVVIGGLLTIPSDTPKWYSVPRQWPRPPGAPPGPDDDGEEKDPCCCVWQNGPMFQETRDGFRELFEEGGEVWNVYAAVREYYRSSWQTSNDAECPCTPDQEIFPELFLNLGDSMVSFDKAPPTWQFSTDGFCPKEGYYADVYGEATLRTDGLNMKTLNELQRPRYIFSDGLHGATYNGAPMPP